MKYPVIDLIPLYEKRIVLAYASKFKGNSNYKKDAQRYEYLLQFAKTLPLDFVVDCEPASGDKSDEPNAGSFLEVALDYHYYNDPEIKEIAKSGGTADITMKNGRGIEVKLSLNGSYFNTPIRQPMKIYFANRSGVYIIEKKDIDYIISTYGKSGHLPYKHYDDPKMKLHKGLSRALGYKVD